MMCLDQEQLLGSETTALSLGSQRSSPCSSNPNGVSVFEAVDANMVGEHQPVWFVASK